MKIFVRLMVILLGLTTQNAIALSKKECKAIGKTLYLQVGQEYNAQFEYTDCVSGKTLLQTVKAGETWNLPNAVLQRTKVKVKVLKDSSEVISGTYDIGNKLTVVCNSANTKIIGKVCSCNGKICTTTN